MATSEKNYLLELWDRNICPNCGADIPERILIAAELSAATAERGLCSLDCIPSTTRQNWLKGPKESLH